MSSTFVDTYYRAVTQQIRTQLNVIDSLVTHAGVKGTNNEQVFRGLLASFLPKRYSLGTGVVFDRQGQRSKQSDIILYDNFRYPQLMGQLDPLLLPVETVYAVVEVKTTLSLAEAKDICGKSESLRSLDIVGYKSTPRTYFLCYNSGPSARSLSTSVLQTFNAVPFGKRPMAGIVLDKGVVFNHAYENLLTSTPPMHCDVFCPLESGLEGFSKDTVTINKVSYPVDASRAFLYFLLWMLADLDAVELSPRPYPELPEHYVRPYYLDYVSKPYLTPTFVNLHRVEETVQYHHLSSNLEL